ncbi:MAG TPA: DUF883 family protein [Usitatibacter sp.]|nr:DUF883 family protein [Usitatibacter sp.]
MQQPSNVQSAKDNLLQDFGRLVGDTEELLRSLASVPGEKAASLRASVEDSLATAKRRMREAQGMAVERASAVARTTDEYVHENPWMLIGAAAAIGVLIGLAISSERR